MWDTEAFWGLDENSIGRSQALLTLGSTHNFPKQKGILILLYVLEMRTLATILLGLEGVWLRVTGKHKKFGRQSLKLISPLRFHVNTLVSTRLSWVLQLRKFLALPTLLLGK